jgi:HipA-like protein
LEGEEYVFRYDRGYVASGGAPIFAFPDVHREYRQPRLSPFFAVRLPPPQREDVKRAIERRHLDPDDVFVMLDAFGRKAASSPYELRVRGSEDDRHSDPPSANHAVAGA